MTGNASYPQHTHGARLLALLLAVLLLVSSLPGHAAMDSCAADCGATQIEWVDHASADCGACAVPTAFPVLSRVPPEALADLADPALVEFIIPPPWQPPKS